jgi:gephyrin
MFMVPLSSNSLELCTGDSIRASPATDSIDDLSLQAHMDAGNPVSTLVCFHLFVKPALHKLSGRRDAAHSIVDAKLSFPCKLDQERPEYHRVALTWEAAKSGSGGCFVAASTGMQRSSRLLSLRSATGLLCMPQGTAEVAELPEGSVVPCILLSSSRAF